MVGGLISNAISAGAGNGLITSALCMHVPKSGGMGKLIVHFDLYEVLNSELSGFYDTVTLLNRVSIKFAVLDSSRNAVYTSPYNTFTNGTAIELSNGRYTIKMLFSAYGFLGGEEQTVTVSGETVYTIKLYKRHFRAMTVTGGEFDAYDGTLISYYGDVNATGQAEEVVGVQQINVYELKWNNWEKILTYDCVPTYSDVVITHCEYYYINGQINGIRSYRTQYFNGIVTAESGSGTNSSYTTTFVGWEDGKAVFVTVRGSNTSTSKREDSYMGLDSLNYIYNAVTLYHDGKIYSGEDSIDDDFFNVYKGKALLKRQREGTSSTYFLGDPRTISPADPADFVKTYLPTINYFNADLLKECETAEQNGGWFWSASLQAVKVYEGDTVQSYNSKMIYDRLEVTKINGVNISWYSEEYSQF